MDVDEVGDEACGWRESRVVMAEGLWRAGTGSEVLGNFHEMQLTKEFLHEHLRAPLAIEHRLDLLFWNCKLIWRHTSPFGHRWYIRFWG